MAWVLVLECHQAWLGEWVIAPTDMEAILTTATVHIAVCMIPGDRVMVSEILTDMADTLTIPIAMGIIPMGTEDMVPTVVDLCRAVMLA